MRDRSLKTQHLLLERIPAHQKLRALEQACLERGLDSVALCRETVSHRLKACYLGLQAFRLRLKTRYLGLQRGHLRLECLISRAEIGFLARAATKRRLQTGHLIREVDDRLPKVDDLAVEPVVAAQEWVEPIQFRLQRTDRISQVGCRLRCGGRETTQCPVDIDCNRRHIAIKSQLPCRHAAVTQRRVEKVAASRCDALLEVSGQGHAKGARHAREFDPRILEHRLELHVRSRKAHCMDMRCNPH